MYKYALIVWAVVYVFCIVDCIRDARSVGKCIAKLLNYLKSADAGTGFFRKHEDYVQRLNELLEYYPVITKHTDFYSSTLSYGYSDTENYNNAVSIYRELLMTRNYKMHDLKRAFNPFVSLKHIFSLPSIIIKWLGFEPSDRIKKIINLLSWIITYLLGMYSDEIKSLINSLFQ